MNKTKKSISGSNFYKQGLKECRSEKEKKDFETYCKHDLWVDCDYLLRKGEKVALVIGIENEVITREIEELTEKENELLLSFYDNEAFGKRKENGDFVELSTWRHDIENSKRKLENAKISIQYRGGEGYHYGWWILKE